MGSYGGLAMPVLIFNQYRESLCKDVYMIIDNNAICTLALEIIVLLRDEASLM